MKKILFLLFGIFLISDSFAINRAEDKNRVKDNFEEFYQDVNDEERVGIKDNKGNIIVPAVYDDIEYINNGLFIAERDDKYGLYKYNSGEIIPLKYDDISIEDYFLEVELNDKMGIINLDGELIIPAIYDDIEFMEDCNVNMFLVELNDKQGLYDMNGKLIVPVKYEDIECVSKDIFVVENKNEKYGVYNSTGKKIIAEKYDDISINRKYIEVEKGDNTFYFDFAGKKIKN